MPESRSRRRSPIFGNGRGLTVPEVMICLAVVGILMGIAGRLYMGALERARVARARAEIRTIEKMIAPRLLDGEPLPATLDELDWKQLDPWGRPYVYLNFETVDDDGSDEPGFVPENARRDSFLKPVNTRFDLYSTGRDGNSDPQLTTEASWDDVLRGSDGVYVGLASEY